MADGEETPTSSVGAGDDATVTAKSVNHFNIHQAKIDVQKFDDKINFGMWRCEVMNVLNSMNLEETLETIWKPKGVLEKRLVQDEL